MPSAAEHNRPVVAVGYDGSESAQLAVRWAAEHAASNGFDLRVVHAWIWPVFTKKLGPVRGVAGSGLRHGAEVILAAGIEHAQSAVAGNGNAPAAGTTVTGGMEAGLPAPVLREAAEDARLLVVGSRGMAAVLGQLAGSVCVELAGSAPCPLLVVRRPHSPGLPVAVGVDASPRAPATLGGAVRLAQLLQAPLRLIHVEPQRPFAAEDAAAAHGRHAPLHGRDLLEQAVREARTSAPGLDVSGVLRTGHSAAKELLAAAADADVLVLGAHTAGIMPGNTVSAVLHRAAGNVLITR